MQIEALLLKRVASFLQCLRHSSGRYKGSRYTVVDINLQPSAPLKLLCTLPVDTPLPLGCHQARA